jgi:hypothetical protein
MFLNLSLLASSGGGGTLSPFLRRAGSTEKSPFAVGYLFISLFIPLF